MIYVQFERPRDEVVGPRVGPFEWVQVTYDTLRGSPNGDTIAMLGEDGDWHMGITRSPLAHNEQGVTWQSVSADPESEPWSDFTISTSSGEAG